MPKKKKSKKIEEKVKSLDEQIAENVIGLIYMSEADAEIIPFAGQQADFVTKENLLLQIHKTGYVKIEEKDFNEFFAPLIKIKDWFGEEEQKMTERFVWLKDLLEQNLRDLKVFKIGKIEIDIYVVGLDKDNFLRGVQTKAVET